MNDCPECGTISEVTPHFEYCKLQERTSKVSVDMQGILEYWEYYRMHDFIDAYKQLMAGTMTVDQANAVMGVNYYKEVK